MVHTDVFSLTVQVTCSICNIKFKMLNQFFTKIKEQVGIVERE